MNDLRSILQRIWRVSVACMMLVQSVVPSFAQSKPKTPLIRDTEIEELLKDYISPILKVAGLTQQNIQIVIINDRTFNAFVADGRRIFINAGALLDAATPNEIIGVLAHEAGHIAGGHLARLRQQLAAAQTASIIAMLLGAGAIAAGAAAGTKGSELSGLAAGAITGPQEVLRRSMLAYARSEEQAADRAAIGYLNATGQSARGMLETFKRFADQMIFTSRYIDPYVQSHPLPAERLSALEQEVKKSPFYTQKDTVQLQMRHDMMRAKLAGFTERPDTIARKYPMGSTTLAARYARAISTYRHGDLSEALRQVDALINSGSSTAYFHELKGQILLESGRVRESIPFLRKAADMAGQAPLVRILLGQALVAQNDLNATREAIDVLNQAIQKEPEVPDAWRQLAIAYDRRGDTANASLAGAQAALISGDIVSARQLATRARNQSSYGSPAWLKADDIINIKTPEEKKSSSQP